MSDVKLYQVVDENADSSAPAMLLTLTADQAKEYRSTGLKVTAVKEDAAHAALAKQGQTPPVSTQSETRDWGAH